MKTPNVFLRRCGSTLRLAVFTLLTLASARAGTHFWAGGDYLWSKPGNWSAGGAPQVGEAAPVVIVLPPAGAKFSTNDIAGLKIDQIVITGNNYNLGVRNGATFDFRGETRAGNPMSGIYVTNLTAKIHGPMVFNNQCRIQGAGSTLTLNGAISGSGTFYLSGPLVEFTGTQTNTFSGDLHVQENELRLNKTNAVAISGPLHIGLGLDNPGKVVVRHLRADQIANTSDVTVRRDGLLDLNGFDDAVHDLRFLAGRVATGAGTLSFTGDITALSNAHPAVIEGKLFVGLGERGIHVEDGAAFDDLQIQAAVSGIAALTKTGPGMLTLSGNNTYSSTVTIADGPVLAQSSTAFGNALGNTIVGANGTVLLMQATYAAETLDLSGLGWRGLGSVHVPEGVGATWLGPVTLSGKAVFMVNSNSLLEVRGVMSGPGGFELQGGGQFLIGGSSPNTHQGASVVAHGRLRLGKPANIPAMAGMLVVGTTNATARTMGIAAFELDHQIPAGATVRVYNDGLVDVSATEQAFGPLLLEMASRIRVDYDGLLTLPSSVIVDGSYFYEPLGNGVHLEHVGSIYGGGRVRLASATTIDVTTAGRGFQITSGIVGPGNASLIKSGPGGLALGTIGMTSTYDGQTMVRDGVLEVNGPAALGSTAGGTVVTNQGQLLLRSSVGNESLVIATDELNPPPFNLASDPGIASAQAFNTNTWAGPVTLLSTARIGCHVTNGIFELAGPITGPGGVHLRDAWNPAAGPSVGTLRLNGSAANTYGGLTRVDQGVIELAKTGGATAIPGPLTIGDDQGAVSSAVVVLRGNEQIANLAPVTIQSDGGLDLNSFEEFIGSLAGSGRVFCHASVLTVGANDQSTVWSGGILGHGPQTILKLGFGTLQITGDNYFSGQTVVQGGALDVRGTLPNSQVVVNNTGKLFGDGTVGRLKNLNGGHTSPGAPVGTLHSGNVEMASPGTFRVELSGLPPGGTCDQLHVTGTVSVGGVLQLVPTNNTPVGSSFVIINNDGNDAVTGTFNGLPENSEFTVNDQRFRISYGGGDGNDVVLTRANAAPSLTSITATSSADEGSLVGLDGVISDPDLADAFTLVVNWGDGTAAQTIQLPAGTTTFHVDHFYADDKPGAQASDGFTIHYTLTDTAGSPAMGNLNTVIGNVAPSFPNLGRLRLKSGEALATTIAFNDPGSDSWTATVDYGDGTGPQPVAVGPDKGVPLSHSFPGDGVYSVTLGVKDDDTGTASATFQVVVGLELSIARRGAAHATVSWPGVFNGCTLQIATALGDAAIWTAVPGAPALFNGQWTVTVPASNAAGYFRLVAPEPE